LLTTTIWAALAAVVVGLITREIKISEFRQAWINGLRDELAQFFDKASRWFEASRYADWEKIRQDRETLKINAVPKELLESEYEALHLLMKIQLRFKPDDENSKDLLEKMENLLATQNFIRNGDPMKDWAKLCDSAIMDGRRLLKTEWETTKNPLPKYWRHMKSVITRIDSFNVSDR
jgi:DNA mismatch repair ATPase MutL